MPGLVPGIHVLADEEDVDGRDKPGHDELVVSPNPTSLLQPRHRDAFARQLVGAFVFVVAGVALDPVPAHLMRF